MKVQVQQVEQVAVQENPPSMEKEGKEAEKEEKIGENQQAQLQSTEDSNVKEEKKENNAEKAVVTQVPIDENKSTGTSGPPTNKGGKKGQKQPLATLSASENIAPVRASKRIREKPLVQYDNENGEVAEQSTETADGAKKKKKKIAFAPKAGKKPPAGPGGKKKSMTLEEHVIKYTEGHEIVLGN